VGPESDWRLDHCSCAPVAAITAGPPMAMPTAKPIPMVDWPVTIILNVTVGPCAGVPRVAALVLKNLPFQTPVTAPRRRGIGASGGAVFSHTVTGAPVAAELRGRAQPWDVCTLLARRFASLTAGYGEDEGALNRGAVACPLHGGSPS
jgi:hypothetical protein